MSSRVRLLGALLVAFACASPAAAQQTVDVGSISGRIYADDGGVLPGVSISVVHSATSVSTMTVSDDQGWFRFPYLRIGEYQLSATLAGFRTFERKIVVSAGSAFDLKITMPVAAAQEVFVDAAEPPLVDTARSQIAATVREAEVAALPMNGRNFLDLALLVPGVAPANVGSTQLFPETSAVPGITLSVGSQRNLSNNFVVDGLSANDDAAGLSGITYGVDAIEEFQVITSGAQAEFGRALGGYVNVVTRSGDNAMRGTLYEFVRDDSLNASNALSGTALPMNQSQFGLSLGGPIVKNRTFYFGNIEKRALDQTGLTTITDPNAAIINGRLAAVSYGGPLIATGIYPNPVDTVNALLKVDQRYGADHHWSIRYGRYDVASTNSRGAGGLNAPSASASLDSVDQVVAVNNALVLSSRSLFETRAQFAHSDLQAPPTDPIGPAVSIAGVAAFGTASGSPTARINRMFQIVNNFSVYTGRHSFRAGFDFLYNDDDITYPRSVRGSYTFSSLANFLSGTYNNAGFAQTFGISDVSQTNPNLGVYLQDEWKLTDAVTINAGLRYDLQFLETINTDTNNVSPRMGFAWTPGSSGRTVVRGGAGLFYDRVPLRALANALLSAGNTTDVTALQQYVVTLSPTQAGAPVFPNILPGAIPLVTLPNLATMDRNLQNAFSRQVSAEVEQQIGDAMTISAGYQYVNGSQLLMSINQNVPRCVASGNNNGCRPVSSYANNSQYSSAGDSTYHGMHVSIARRAREWGHFRVSYTLSKAMNNVGEFFFSSPIDPTDLSKDWGRADNDQRHRVVLNASLHKHGFQVGAMMQAYSAPPFNITSGVTTVQGTPGRPIVDGAYIPRNSGEGSPFFSLNARLGYTFTIVGRWQMELIAEGFNLTDHVNVVTRNTNFGTGAYPTNPLPTFNQITAVGEPRSFQVGARLRF